MIRNLVERLLVDIGTFIELSLKQWDSDVAPRLKQAKKAAVAFVDRATTPELVLLYVCLTLFLIIVLL